MGKPSTRILVLCYCLYCFKLIDPSFKRTNLFVNIQEDLIVKFYTCIIIFCFYQFLHCPLILLLLFFLVPFITQMILSLLSLHI